MKQFRIKTKTQSTNPENSNNKAIYVKIFESKQGFPTKILIENRIMVPIHLLSDYECLNQIYGNIYDIVRKTNKYAIVVLRHYMFECDFELIIDAYLKLKQNKND